MSEAPLDGGSSVPRTPLRPRVLVDPRGRRRVAVPPYAARDRLDSFLYHYAEVPARSRSEWQKLIGLGVVRLNGQTAKPSTRVADGDSVTIAPTPAHLDVPPQEAVAFRVVYDDPSMIVLDKPAGVVVHPAPGNETGTLVNGLLARFPELRDVTGDLRPGIVHRLDKDTSGLMVVGRTPHATADLQRQMQARETEKRYLLLVQGNIEEDEGLIDKAIARDLRNRQRMAVRADGRSAQTRFTVLERFGDWTYLEALLLTGRTHQLRVHFASIGHSIAGDATYGSGRAPGGLTRQFVHSGRLRLTSPHDHRRHEFRADPHADLQQALEFLRRRGSRA